MLSTKFYKSRNQCHAVFFNPTGFTSYQMSDMVYKEFQKWVKKEMEFTGVRGVYMSDEKTQDRVKRMLIDHIQFPY